MRGSSGVVELGDASRAPRFARLAQVGQGLALVSGQGLALVSGLFVRGQPPRRAPRAPRDRSARVCIGGAASRATARRRAREGHSSKPQAALARTVRFGSRRTMRRSSWSATRLGEEEPNAWLDSSRHSRDASKVSGGEIACTRAGARRIDRITARFASSMATRFVAVGIGGRGSCAGFGAVGAWALGRGGVPWGSRRNRDGRHHLAQVHSVRRRGRTNHRRSASLA